MNTSGDGPPMHHAHVFALVGGEPPLLPLILSDGFGCMQLEQLFKPIRTFSSLPLPLHHFTPPSPVVPPTHLLERGPSPELPLIVP